MSAVSERGDGMQNLPDEPKERRGRSLTPLWVISLFLSLTETVLGVGVIQTRGNVQWALVLFVTLFPLLIAVGFFVILWDRPYVFYSPGEYGSQDVAKYVEAMQRRYIADSDLYASIQNTIQTTLASSAIVEE